MGGDLDTIITHLDGSSHSCVLLLFLKSKYVKSLKDMKFLREGLVFSTHSKEGTDSGVALGLCTYPGHELRYHIDLKVYPRYTCAFGVLD